jgi:hypothetical protein
MTEKKRQEEAQKEQLKKEQEAQKALLEGRWDDRPSPNFEKYLE